MSEKRVRIVSMIAQPPNLSVDTSEGATISRLIKQGILAGKNRLVVGEIKEVPHDG